MEGIDWTFIDSMINDRYRGKYYFIYSPDSLFKAQLLLFLGKASSNRDLAEQLRFNTKYCVLCGFDNFLRTPVHATFSHFKKKIGSELFYIIMHRVIAKSIPIMVENHYNISADRLHIQLFSKNKKLLNCNCKGKCQYDNLLAAKDYRNARKKVFIFSQYKIQLFICRLSQIPFAARIRSL